MSSEQFLELLTKYGNESELFGIPDVDGLNFIHSVMGQCEFNAVAAGAPFETSNEFMSALSAKTGLEVQNVASRGGNCFFHAFWVAYYGSQPDRDDITGLRHRVACRIFSKWSDCDYRSCVTLNEDYAEFVQPSTQKFDLARFLSHVADENQEKYQLYGDGLMMALVAEIFKCVLVIVCVKTEGCVSRIEMGTGATSCGQLTVYVAWDGRNHSAHYFAFLGNPGARVMKWAELSPPAMIGTDVDIERTREREFSKCMYSYHDYVTEFDHGMDRSALKALWKKTANATVPVSTFIIVEDATIVASVLGEIVGKTLPTEFVPFPFNSAVQFFEQISSKVGLQVKRVTPCSNNSTLFFETLLSGVFGVKDSSTMHVRCLREIMTAELVERWQKREFRAEVKTLPELSKYYVSDTRFLLPDLVQDWMMGAGTVTFPMTTLMLEVMATALKCQLGIVSLSYPGNPYLFLHGDSAARRVYIGSNGLSGSQQRFFCFTASSSTFLIFAFKNITLNDFDE